MVSEPLFSLYRDEDAFCLTNVLQTNAATWH